MSVLLPPHPELELVFVGWFLCWVFGFGFFIYFNKCCSEASLQHESNFCSVNVIFLGGWGQGRVMVFVEVLLFVYALS